MSKDGWVRMAFKLIGLNSWECSMYIQKHFWWLMSYYHPFKSLVNIIVCAFIYSLCAFACSMVLFILPGAFFLSFFRSWLLLLFVSHWNCFEPYFPAMAVKVTAQAKSAHSGNVMSLLFSASTKCVRSHCKMLLTLEHTSN